MIRVLSGDCRTVLATLPDASVQCCVTSPPYYGLRDYGMADQIGLEPTPDEYVAQMVAVFREVRRVLRDDGVLWLNVGDSYNAPMAGNKTPSGFSQTRPSRLSANGDQETVKHGRGLVSGIKPKDLLGIPWLLAFALRADGWYLRSDVIWAKPSPMPESVRDRPTKAHEYVFLLTKSARYFWDADAVAEAAKYAGTVLDYTGNQKANTADPVKQATLPRGRKIVVGDTRNIRTVWNITTQPFSGAHFATMPPELADRCIKSGSRAGDTVLDPFGGAGTTGLVAARLGRNAILIELNPAYADMAKARIHDDAPLLGSVA